MTMSNTNDLGIASEKSQNWRRQMIGCIVFLLMMVNCCIPMYLFFIGRWDPYDIPPLPDADYQQLSGHLWLYCGDYKICYIDLKNPDELVVVTYADYILTRPHQDTYDLFVTDTGEGFKLLLNEYKPGKNQFNQRIIMNSFVESPKLSPNRTTIAFIAPHIEALQWLDFNGGEIYTLQGWCVSQFAWLTEDELLIRASPTNEECEPVWERPEDVYIFRLSNSEIRQPDESELLENMEIGSFVETGDGRIVVSTVVKASGGNPDQQQVAIYIVDSIRGELTFVTEVEDGTSTFGRLNRSGDNRIISLYVGDAVYVIDLSRDTLVDLMHPDVLLSTNK